MLIPGADANRAFARSVRRRINAASFAERSRALVWRLAGYSLLAAGAGVGLSAAFLGWAQINLKPAEEERIAAAIERALNRASIAARGEVTLADASGNPLTLLGSVGLSPESKARVEGAVGVREEALDLPRVLDSPRPPNAAPVVTNYTIFKTLRFGSGQVVTGWNFASSAASSPESQYCYYSEKVSGAEESVTTLGQNGRAIAWPSRPGFDPAAAFSQCVWF